MNDFQPKLNYIRKVMVSIEKPEQFEIVEEWSRKVLSKHKFADQNDKSKGVIRLHRMTKELNELLERKWMQNQK